MPIQIMHKGDRDQPVVACDHCGEVIEEAKQGNYEWRLADGLPEDGRIFFTHKECCHAFEAANGGRPRWYAIGLECLPIYLATNLQIDLEKAQKTARMMATLEVE